MIIDHADSFTDQPAVSFPVELDVGHPKTTSINIAPYSPLWCALRCNLARLAPLQPLHLARLAPPRRGPAHRRPGRPRRSG